MTINLYLIIVSIVAAFMILAILYLKIQISQSESKILKSAAQTLQKNLAEIPEEKKNQSVTKIVKEINGSIPQESKIDESILRSIIMTILILITQDDTINNDNKNKGDDTE